MGVHHLHHSRVLIHRWIGGADVNMDDYAAKVARKLVSAGWTRLCVSHAFECTLSTVNGLLGITPRRKVKLNPVAVRRAEFLPELRNAEMHFISQLVGLGFSHKEIAERTGISFHIIVGRIRRSKPDYQAIASLIALADGRAESISPHPNCVYGDCLASGYWLPVAESTFCPVHAELAARVLNLRKVPA